jgi:hypothetical protein
MEVMAVAESESATSLAWYSRMLRIRRGPNTNDCTISEIWNNPVPIAPLREYSYRNDEPGPHAGVSEILTYRWECWRQVKNEAEARDSNEAGMFDPLAETVVMFTTWTHLAK